MDYLKPERKYDIKRVTPIVIRVYMPADLYDELHTLPYWERCAPDGENFYHIVILPTYNTDDVIAWLDTWLEEKTNDIPLSDIWRLDE